MTATTASREVWYALEKQMGLDGLTEWAYENGRVIDLEEVEKNE